MNGLIVTLVDVHGILTMTDFVLINRVRTLYFAIKQHETRSRSLR